MSATRNLSLVDSQIRRRIGAKPPSEETIRKAAGLIDQGRVSHVVHPATVYHVEGEHGRYIVAVYSAGGKVIDAECSCRTESVCSHMLAVLAHHKHSHGEDLTP